MIPSRARRRRITCGVRCACAALGALVWTLAAPSRASATTGIMGITGNTTLTENHQGQISIEVDDVTLDCNWYFVTFLPGLQANCGFTSNQTCGIRVAQRSNVTIRNCWVAGEFGYGFWIGNTTGTHIENGVTTTSITGFRMEFNENLSMTGGGPYATALGGIEVRNSVNTQFVNVSAQASGGDGFDENDCSSTYYGTSSSLENGVNGFECDGGMYTWYDRVQSLDNGQHGISIDSTFGFFAQASSNNNVEDGIRVQSSSNESTVMFSAASGNGRCDLNQDATCINNTWSSNTYGTKCGTVP